MMTNKDRLFTIPNKHFYIVWNEFVMKNIGMGSTDSSIAIGEWLGECYDENDWVWQDINYYLYLMK